MLKLPDALTKIEEAMAGPSAKAKKSAPCPACGLTILKGTYVRPIFKPTPEEAAAKNLPVFREGRLDTAWWIHQKCFFRLVNGQPVQRVSYEGTKEFWSTAPVLILEMRERNLPITDPMSPANRS